MALENTKFVELNHDEMLEADGGCWGLAIGLLIGCGIAIYRKMKKK